MNDNDNCFEYLGQTGMSRSSGQGQGHRSKNVICERTFACDRRTINAQVCYTSLRFYVNFSLLLVDNFVSLTHYVL